MITIKHILNANVVPKRRDQLTHEMVGLSVLFAYEMISFFRLSEKITNYCKHEMGGKDQSYENIGLCICIYGVDLLFNRDSSSSGGDEELEGSACAMNALNKNSSECHNMAVEETNSNCSSPKTQEEYADRITRLQMEYLIPLKEDLSDWLNRILGCYY
ncbi:unnamed protein product [Medioppia subpectinata]|uniref:Uncharacterized protein n=1 Tax=Medioppia subpectinata TaxID=1979941 RepID=A0A7R9PYG7_9ACAR|nr:unnamed protein product [Medioppia subpectinata]CAG2105872.1 unnamed protein product [Medioppia subpectinata]